MVRTVVWNITKPIALPYGSVCGVASATCNVPRVLGRTPGLPASVVTADEIILHGSGPAAGNHLAGILVEHPLHIATIRASAGAWLVQAMPGVAVACCNFAQSLAKQFRFRGHRGQQKNAQEQKGKCFFHDGFS